jgi:hypothetical protein
MILSRLKSTSQGGEETLEVGGGLNSEILTPVLSLGNGGELEMAKEGAENSNWVGG